MAAAETQAVAGDSKPFVYELGEESDAWFVEDTADVAVALKAIEDELRDVFRTDEPILVEILALLPKATTIARDDWQWADKPPFRDFDSMLWHPGAPWPLPDGYSVDADEKPKAGVMVRLP